MVPSLEMQLGQVIPFPMTSYGWDGRRSVSGISVGVLAIGGLVRTELGNVHTFSAAHR